MAIYRIEIEAPTADAAVDMYSILEEAVLDDNIDSSFSEVTLFGPNNTHINRFEAPEKNSRFTQALW